MGIDKCSKPTFFGGLKECLPSNSEIICKTLNQIVNSEYCEPEVNEKGKLQQDNLNFSDKLNIENNKCILSETTTPNEISSELQNTDTYTQIKHNNNNTLDSFSVVQSEWSRLQNIIPTLPEPILDKLGHRLKNITNSSQIASFMCSLSIKSSNITKEEAKSKYNLHL